MPSYIAEAVEIITDTGSGIPTTYTNTALGLASDGHFYLITGRFGLDGTKVVTGPVASFPDTWYEGVLSADFSAGISRNADFSDVGCMETVSSFSFPIVNTAAFRATLKTNSVHLGKRRVKYYRVTSSDLVTFTFEQRWQGVIDDEPFDELTQSIQCVDNSKDIFKSLPRVPVTTSNFEGAPQESRDKMLPIVLGRVAHSPLVNVAKSGEKVTLNIIDSADHKIAAVTHGSATSLLIRTSGIAFVANDTRLVGKYVSIVSGGSPQIIRIKSNEATYTTPADLVDITELILDDRFDETDPIVEWEQSQTGSGLNLRYAEVVDFKPVLVASAKPISEFKVNSAGRPGLYTYKSDRNVFDDISEMNISTSTSDIETTGYPGYSILAKSADTDGSLFSYFNLYPTDITVVSLTDWDTEDLPAVGTSAALLFDRLDNTAGYTLTGSTFGASVVFDVMLPGEDLLKQFDEIYILPDFVHNRVGGGSSTTEVTAGVQGKDIYGRIGAAVLESLFINQDVESADEEAFYLPKFYYGATGADATFYRDKSQFNITELIGDSKKSKAYTALRLTIAISHGLDPTSYTLKLRQIGVIGRRAVGVTSESIYGTLIGETFGTQWDGRKTSSSAILTIVDGLEHLVRNHDTSDPVWATATAYVIGDTIRGTNDTGHIFVCTVAGTSHVSSEPTWTDTAGATYADGTVTWRELREIPIDAASFDALSGSVSGLRKDWFFGRALLDQKKSEEYYKEILSQAFLIGSVSPTGNLSVKAWREETTPAASFTSANIMQGTLGQMKLTPMGKVYNDFLIRYDWNPGAGKYNKQIFVTNVDKPAFPAATAVSLGAFSVSFTSFAVGFGRYVVIYSFTTTLPHGRATGDYVRLTGNTEDYNFSHEITVTGANAFLAAFLRTGEPDSEPSTSGLLEYVDPDLEWKQYVGGIESYDVAKALWDDCRASYVITKTVNRLPRDLGDCPWFIDPYAKDAADRYIWSTDGTQSGLDLDVGDEHPAVFYLRNLVAWTTRQKEQIDFEVIDNSSHSALQIGSCVEFNDAKLTGGVALTGWIHEKTQIPRTNKLPERFRFGVTLEPT